MRKVLVSGGNRGIGLAVVKQMASQQNDLILMGCRDLEVGRELASTIGDNVIATYLDLSDREGTHSSMKNILAEHKCIDVLINNAAISRDLPFDEIPVEEFDETIRVNVTAPFELVRAVFPSMKKSGYGRIVNVSSGYGSFEEGLSGPFAYSFSKAALNALTLTISRDLVGDIKINSMTPGWCRTRMGGEEAPRSAKKGAETIVWLANLDKDGPNGGFFRDKEEIGW